MLDETIAGVAIDRTFPGLPGRDYHDEVWQRERETVFSRTWFCVGRTDEIADPGDYVARDVAGSGVLAVRGKDGVVRAFYNVCRHRGTVLCDEGAGSSKGAFSCPYHNWVYDLEGTLIGTPNVRDGDDFDPTPVPTALRRLRRVGGVRLRPPRTRTRSRCSSSLPTSRTGRWSTSATGWASCGPVTASSTRWPRTGRSSTTTSTSACTALACTQSCPTWCRCTARAWCSTQTGLTSVPLSTTA